MMEGSWKEEKMRCGCVALEPVITPLRCESKWRACPCIQLDRLVIISLNSNIYAQLEKLLFFYSSLRKKEDTHSFVCVCVTSTRFAPVLFLPPPDGDADVGGYMTTATCWMCGERAELGGSVFPPVAVIDPLLEKSLECGGWGRQGDGGKEGEAFMSESVSIFFCPKEKGIL